MKGLYDSHFHLSIMKKKGMDVSSILEDCFARGFRGGIDIGTGIEDFAERKELTSPYPSILLSAGMYPSEAAGEWRDRLPALRDQCADARVAAVGEIGIDLHWNYASRGEQSALFRAQLDMADEAGLPVIVHCRKAEPEITDVLKSGIPSRGGVLHCFSADYAWARQFLDLGLYISFAGNLTYPGSADLREAAMRIPADRILLETDSPYLSPVPVRGRPNHPGNTAHTRDFLASLRGIDPMDLTAAIGENFLRLFAPTRAGAGGFPR